MPKISVADVSKYSSGGGGAGFFRLKDDGDTASIRFMLTSEEDLNDCVYVVHEVKVGENEYPKPVNCLREYDAPVSDCPFCAEGIPTSTKLVLPLYDVEDESVKIWTRGRTFIAKMTSLCSRYKDLVSHTFDIERVGAKGDQKTSYEIYETGQDDTQLEDLPEIPEILGDRFVLDKSAEDMEFYLEAHEFPPEDNDDDPPRRRRSKSKRADEDDDAEVPFDEEERPRRRAERRDTGRRTPAKGRDRQRKEDKF